MASKSLRTKVQCPVSVWIAIALMVTGWFLNFLSFVAPYWNREETFKWGLWLMCTGETHCEAISNTFMTDIMQAAKICLTIGFVTYIVVIVLFLLYLYWKSDLRFLAASAGTSFLTLLCIFLGALLWVSSTNTSLFFCYYLSYTSALFLATSCGLILHVRRQERLRIAELHEQERNLNRQQIAL